MYALFERARQEEPVFFSPDIGYWVVTRRADILQVFRDPTRLSASIALSPVTPLSAAVLEFLRDGGFAVEATQVSVDRPTHTRIRSIATKLLNPREFNTLAPQVREIVGHCTDALIGRGRVDLVRDFAYDLPALVIFRILGIPDDDIPKIKRWADNRLLLTFGKLAPGEQMAAARQMLDYWRYCVCLVDDRLRTPRADYASKLIAQRNGDDGVLTLNEIASLVFGILLAGHETTTNMIANALRVLLTHPDQWSLLCNDARLIPNAVEETLRFMSSVVCWRRRALTDVEIGGVCIPAGSNVLLALGSGNHDEAHFKNPEILDVRRSNARDHVSFGHGIHFCLGAPLARIELQIVLEELCRRLPAMSIACDMPIDVIKTIAFRGPEHLWADLNQG